MSTNGLITAEQFAVMPTPAGMTEELVRGTIRRYPLPTALHGITCSCSASLVADFVSARKLGILTLGSGVITERNPDTVFGPDIGFWSHARCPQIPEGYFTIPPDLAIEVVSPDDSHTRLLEKVRHYLKSGVRLVWVIDPELRIVTVYRSKELAKTLDNGDVISGEDVLPGFECPVSSFFD